MVYWIYDNKKVFTEETYMLKMTTNKDPFKRLIDLMTRQNAMTTIKLIKKDKWLISAKKLHKGK